MTNRTIVSIIILLLIAASASSQFEGVVESTSLTTDETGTMVRYPMTMLVKGEMVKIVIPAVGQNQPTTMIYRRDRGMMWVLNDETKTYFEIVLSDEGANRESPDDQAAGEGPQPQRTGKSRTILGYACDQVLVKTGEVETEFWGTKQLGELARTISHVFGDGSADEGSPWGDEITKMGYFPLVAKTRLQGKVLESMEVTRIARKSLPGDMFDIPSGYRKEGAKDLLERDGSQ
jgi:hypothetical protein